MQCITVSKIGENVENPTNQNDLSSEWIDRMSYIINNNVTSTRKTCAPYNFHFRVLLVTKSRAFSLSYKEKTLKARPLVTIYVECVQPNIIDRMLYVNVYYTCIYVGLCTDICMHVCMYACMHVWMYACMLACMHVCINTRAFSLSFGKTLKVPTFEKKNISSACIHTLACTPAHTRTHNILLQYYYFHA